MAERGVVTSAPVSRRVQAVRSHAVRSVVCSLFGRQFRRLFGRFVWWVASARWAVCWVAVLGGGHFFPFPFLAPFPFPPPFCPPISAPTCIRARRPCNANPRPPGVPPLPPRLPRARLRRPFPCCSSWFWFSAAFPGSVWCVCCVSFGCGVCSGGCGGCSCGCGGCACSC